MAAVLPFLEVPPDERSDAPLIRGTFGTYGGDVNDFEPADYLSAIEGGEEDDDSSYAGYGEEKAKAPPRDKSDGSLLPSLAKSHTELSNLIWKRQILANEVARRTFTLEERKRGSMTELILRADRPFDTKMVPWWKVTESAKLSEFSVFSTNKKMACPTFDLPAGGANAGGSCPAASFGQTITANSEEPHVLPDDRAVDLNTAICQRCYATGGKYGEVSVQIREIIVYAFVKRMMSLDPEKLRDALAYGVLHCLDHLHSKPAFDKYGHKFLRVHSSGDFFSQPYADVWLGVARQVELEDPSLRLWAPTRTQVLPTWPEFWANAGVPDNFAIRPSAYHVGDHAPDAVCGAAGSSVLTPAQTTSDIGEKYDWACPVYGMEKASTRTCNDAPGPSDIGKPRAAGCRVCWLGRDLRVNYTAH